MKQKLKFAKSICNMLVDYNVDHLPSFSEEDTAKYFYNNTKLAWNKFPDIIQNMKQMLMLEKKNVNQ